MEMENDTCKICGRNLEEKRAGVTITAGGDSYDVLCLEQEREKAGNNQQEQEIGQETATEPQEQGTEPEPEPQEPDTEPDTKPAEPEQVKRFEPKIEIKVIKALAGLLQPEERPISEEQAIKLDYCSVIDASQVSMVVAVSEEAKRCLSRFYCADSYTSNRRDRIIEEEQSKSWIVGWTGFKVEYVKKITKILEASGDYATLLTGHNRVFVFKNKHFKVYLACRINTEE